MNIMTVFIGTGVLLFVSMLLGVAISCATYFFHVEEDSRIEDIYQILPHFNCGSCGYPGCMPYAESIIKKNEILSKCKPGGAATAEKIRALLAENPLNE